MAKKSPTLIKHDTVATKKAQSTTLARQNDRTRDLKTAKIS
jgi:hypothetical protein